MFEIVSATRLTEYEFWNKSPLGLSLKRLSGLGIWEAHVSYNNVKGLPEIYNNAIKSNLDDDMLIFVHDDVWLDDCFVLDRVYHGLQHFDVIGLAGKKRRVEKQPGWAFVDTQFTWDKSENLSGCVAHGQFPMGEISYFGGMPANCELLDGVLLASRRSKLNSRSVYFDELFSFDFYDLDFCRTAKQRGLSLGTWSIAITHQSAGAFGKQEWLEGYKVYLEKWQN